MIRRELVDDAVNLMLSGSTGKQVGESVIPVAPVLPYVVMYPLDSPAAIDEMGSRENYREFLYQFTCVGATARQANWMADRVVAAFTDQADGGSWTNALALPMTYVVVHRAMESTGAAERMAEQIWQRVETLRLTVHKT